MMRIALILVVSVFFLPLVQAASEPYWTHQFESGYISTQPLVVDDSVYVRTSGFWTGEDRPIVAAFELQNGTEKWRYTSQTSRQHDMSPLVFVEKGSGACGSWNDVLLVGWSDGKITALSPTDGSIIWQNQTEVDLIGITGKMVVEDDRVIVPTRTGLSSFCLADGSELLDIDSGHIGWRNGVTITEQGYIYGDETGSLHTVNRNGTVSTTSVGEGKIRHAPLDTRHGLFIHLQTDQGSIMYLNGSVIGTAGPSPAIPILHNNRIYAATSNEWISILCDNVGCEIDAMEPFHSNGELSLRVVNSDIEVWAPSNTPNGGWGVFNETSLVRIETTAFDTYGTAAPGFGQETVALGNDAGILAVLQKQTVESSPASVVSNPLDIVHYATIIVLFFLTCAFFASQDWQRFVKVGSAFLLVVALAIVPTLSLELANRVESERDVEWGDSWPDEWKGTQVLVIEIDGEEHVIGGLEQQDTVYGLTVLGCDSLGILTEIEQQYLGAYLVSFNGSVGDGWEFTIDGNRVPVGMTDADIDADSIVEWRPA